MTPVIGEKQGTSQTKYELVKLTADKQRGEWNLRIKKVISKV
jgi:hypothetical protein